jgi:hypothetical protein
MRPEPFALITLAAMHAVSWGAVGLLLGTRGPFIWARALTGAVIGLGIGLLIAWRISRWITEEQGGHRIRLTLDGVCLVLGLGLFGVYVAFLGSWGTLNAIDNPAGAAALALTGSISGVFVGVIVSVFTARLVRHPERTTASKAWRWMLGTAFAVLFGMLMAAIPGFFDVEAVAGAVALGVLGGMFGAVFGARLAGPYRRVPLPRDIGDRTYRWLPERTSPWESMLLVSAGAFIFAAVYLPLYRSVWDPSFAWVGWGAWVAWGGALLGTIVLLRWSSARGAGAVFLAIGVPALSTVIAWATASRIDTHLRAYAGPGALGLGLAAIAIGLGMRFRRAEAGDPGQEVSSAPQGWMWARALAAAIVMGTAVSLSILLGFMGSVAASVGRTGMTTFGLLALGSLAGGIALGGRIVPQMQNPTARRRAAAVSTVICVALVAVWAVLGTNQRHRLVPRLDQLDLGDLDQWRDVLALALLVFLPLLVTWRLGRLDSLAWSHLARAIRNVSGIVVLGLVLSAAMAVVATASAPAASWRTDSVFLEADGFFIEAGHARFVANSSSLRVHSYPGDLQYTTLEVEWVEHGVDMCLYVGFHSNGNEWWADDIRTCNGRSPSGWLYYAGASFRSSLGDSFREDVDLETTTGEVPGIPGRLHFDGLSLQAFTAGKGRAENAPANVPRPAPRVALILVWSALGALWLASVARNVSRAGRGEPPAQWRGLAAAVLVGSGVHPPTTIQNAPEVGTVEVPGPPPTPRERRFLPWAIALLAAAILVATGTGAYIWSQGNQSPQPSAAPTPSASAPVIEPTTPTGPSEAPTAPTGPEVPAGPVAIVRIGASKTAPPSTDASGNPVTYEAENAVDGSRQRRGGPPGTEWASR